MRSLQNTKRMVQMIGSVCEVTGCDEMKNFIYSCAI